MENELSIKISASAEKALQSLDRLIPKINQTDNCVSKMLMNFDKNGQLTGFTTELKKLDSEMDKVTKSSKNLKGALNLGIVFAGAKQIFSTGLSWMQKSIDYTEALNLFNVVLDESIDKGTKFQNVMSEAFGTNQTDTLTRQALYQSMAENMGIAQEYAYVMSETTTKLVNDISSLYNKDEDTVAEALRAGIYAGQTKPLRSFGMDITEKSLQPTLDKLDLKNADGTARTVRQLSQAEKQILRYITVLEQSGEAHGDWANTIESPSNQLKIFSNQLVEAQKAFSNLFIGTFGSILPYANAILMVIKEVANAIATMFGIEIEDYNTGIADIGDAFVDIEDGATGASNAVKELKRQTLGFDQINNITENKNSDSGGDGSLIGGIDQKLLDAITSYDNGMDSVRMKATEIRDRIMEWLGFTKEVDETTGKVSFKLKEGWSNFKLIVGTISATAISTISLKIIGSIAKIITLFSKASGIIKTSFNLLTKVFSATNTSLGSVTALTGSLGIIVAGIMAIATSLIYAYQTNDIFREKVENMISTVSKLIMDLLEIVTTVMTQIWKVIEPIWNFIKDTIVLAVKYIYESCVLNFSNIIDVISGFVNIVSSLMHGDFSSAIDYGIETISNLFENWKNYFSKISEMFGTWIEKTINNVKTFVVNFITKLGDILTWIKKLPEKFGYWFGYAIGTAYKKITGTNWIELGKTVLNGIVNGIKNIGTKMKDFVSDLFKKIGEAIKNIDWASIGKNVLDGIVKGMTGMGGKLKDWASGFVEGIKDSLGIHSPSKLVIDAKIGNYTSQAIEVGMEDELPRFQKQAKNIVDRLKNTFDNETYNLSLTDLKAPSLNRQLSSMTTLNIKNAYDFNSIKQASYEGFVMAIKQYGLVQVNVDAKTEEGTILRTAVKGIQEHVVKTGELPFTVPV